MKKAFAFILAASMLLSMTACKKKESEADRNTIQAGKYTFTKVTDYLFETTLDNYESNKDEASKYMNMYRPELGGCSSIQNGKIRGRNYDWTYDEEPEFVIHVPANANGRHASIGVAATTEITAADVESGKEFDVYKIIPYFTLDGINDAGLTININVVGFGEKGEFVMKTEDPNDDVCPIMIPRLLLDQAGSIDEALEIMSKMDIYSLGNAEEAHFMISGPQSSTDSTFNTVVVELIPDANKHYQLSVIDYNKGDFVDNKPIMTNFHLTDYDGTLESATRHPMGYERYQILMENFNEGATVIGMMDLMEKVYYSRLYDIYGDYYWYSELAEGDLDMTLVGEKSLHGDSSKAGGFAEIVQLVDSAYQNMERNGKFWHTVHTSVYDIDSKTLYVVPQEGGYAFTFTLG